MKWLNEFSGIELSACGINGIGFPADTALKVLDRAEKEQVAVLGGDVLIPCGESWEHSYDSWHSDQKTNEFSDEFQTRSIQEARRYIGKYLNKTAIFLIVFR